MGFIKTIIKSWSIERLEQQIKKVESFPKENINQRELQLMKDELKSRGNDYQYFKLVKVSITGEKIGYYNSDLDPEDSWPTKDVDSAQILTRDQVKSVMVIVNLQKKHFKTQYHVQEIGVY